MLETNIFKIYLKNLVFPQHKRESLLSQVEDYQKGQVINQLSSTENKVQSDHTDDIIMIYK